MFTAQVQFYCNYLGWHIRSFLCALVTQFIVIVLGGMDGHHREVQTLRYHQLYQGGRAGGRGPRSWRHHYRHRGEDLPGLLRRHIGSQRRPLQRAGQRRGQSPDRPADLAEKLAEILPDPLEKTFFCNSGAEAIEGALRAIKKFNGRRETISLMASFHGRTYGTLSITGQSGRKRGGGPYAPGSAFAPVPYCYRCLFHMSYPECGLACAEAAEDTFRYQTSDDVAAFITEPVMGEGGIPCKHRLLPGRGPARTVSPEGGDGQGVVPRTSGEASDDRGRPRSGADDRRRAY